MNTERKQLNVRRLARHWYEAGKQTGRALAVTVLFASSAIRGAAHFVFVPRVWQPRYWKRSELSSLSQRMAHMTVDGALLALLVIVPLAIAWS